MTEKFQSPDVTVTLTPREFTLVRVALITRLGALKDRPEMADSYNGTKALLDRGGKLAITAGLACHQPVEST